MGKEKCVYFELRRRGNGRDWFASEAIREVLLVAVPNQNRETGFARAAAAAIDKTITSNQMLARTHAFFHFSLSPALQCGSN